MSTYDAKTLLELWKKGELTTEMAVGHLIQRLLDHEERLTGGGADGRSATRRVIGRKKRCLYGRRKISNNISCIVFTSQHSAKSAQKENSWFRPLNQESYHQ